MSRVESVESLVKDFVEIKSGIWEHKLLTGYKIELYNSKYRVWKGEDVIYSSMFLDRSLKCAAEELAKVLYTQKIGG